MVDFYVHVYSDVIFPRRVIYQVLRGVGKGYTLMKQESISFIQPSTSDISLFNVGREHTQLENPVF